MKTMIAKKHFDYLVLLFAAIISIVLVGIYSSNKQVINLVVISFAAFYFLWGIIHHKYEGSLHPEIIFEYLLFSVLGALLIIGLI